VEYPFSIKVSSETDTVTLAQKFASQLNKGAVVILNGELGAGKTFFIKNAVSFFGVTNASSPTFAIVNVYKGKQQIYHFDFYRINKASELFDVGFNDYLNDEEAIIFIEWGNLIPQILPSKRIQIYVEILEETKRLFRFEKYE
jgi:tRNA threonylcarbamoyladenosine biosynthesis protein TsaE